MAAAWRRYQNTEYARWVKNEIPPTKGNFDHQPLISIVVPVHRYKERYLDDLIGSVLNQDYGNWELVVVNACDDKLESKSVSSACSVDGRIREVVLDRNLHISGNTNAGIKAAKGEYIAFLDYDDTLAPFALSRVVERLQVSPRPDLFYSDEDKLSDDGRLRQQPFFKPEFALELFLASNYICHFSVVRAELAKRVGGLRIGYEGAQDYDFLLRVMDHRPLVAHVASMSYHWRLAEGSTAGLESAKSYAGEAGRRALDDYLGRNQINATVLPGDQSTSYRVKYSLPDGTRIYLAGSGHAKAEGVQMFRPSTSLRDEDVLIILASDANPIGNDWAQELASKALQPGVGVVGGAIEIGSRGFCGYVMQAGILEPLGFDLNRPWASAGSLNWPAVRVVPPLAMIAVSGRVLRDCQSVDPLEICLKAFQGGFRNVYWPYARAKILQPPIPIKASVGTVKKDPYFNPNLKVKNGRISLR